MARALEAEQSPPWFEDSLALALARRIGSIRAASGDTAPEIGEVLRTWIAVRTRFLDELMVDAADDGVRQIVIVGAGLDARAFRLPVPADLAFFEVDRADVAEVKERLVSSTGIKPTSRRVMVVGDVLDPDWVASLTDAGWRAGRPTLWVLEGLLIYFTPDTRHRLLSQLTRVSAPGSRLAVEVSTRDADPTRPLWHPFENHDFAGWLAEFGWDTTQVTTMAELSSAYGRPLTREAATHYSGVLIDAHLP